MDNNGAKHYWKAPGVDSDPRSDVEVWLDQPAPGRIGRRGFLRAAGFGIAVSMTGCSVAPERQALPHIDHPEGVVPGRAQFYATVCGGCEAGCGALVRCREGRPVKIEGLPGHPLSRGGLCAAGQAGLLGLYDSHRYRGPRENGNETTWEAADTAIVHELRSIRERGGRVRVLTGTLTSPTLRAAIAGFLAAFADGRHVAYDALSASAILDAHAATHGVRALPRYRFEQASVIAALDADFLGTWVSPVEYTAAYSARRNPDHEQGMNWHVQFEPRMSLTGANADARHRVAPGDMGALALALALRVAARTGTPLVMTPPADPPVAEEVLDTVADRLVHARGESLVVCGVQDVDIQKLCNFMNAALDNYGDTLDLAAPSHQKDGDDGELATLLQELEAGEVDALFVLGANPVYDLPDGERIAAWMDIVPLTVYFGARPDETAAHARFVCPEHHYLESWLDAEPAAGVVTLRQPVVRPLFGTRAALESFLAWSGTPAGARDAIQAHWRAHVHPSANRTLPFERFWDKTLSDGWARVRRNPVDIQFYPGAVTPPAMDIQSGDGQFSLVLYPKAGPLDGRNAFNPWLQELPDPVSKVAWDNYACLSAGAAAALGLGEGDVVRIAADGRGGVELPVHVQPGQHDRVVAVALGYGSETSRRFAELGPEWIGRHPTVGSDGLVGVNAAPFLRLEGGLLRYARGGVQVTPTGKRRALASTQTHHMITVPENLARGFDARRPIVQETTLAAYRRDPASGRPHAHHVFEGAIYPDDHPKPKHHWAMVVDLSKCTGCSGCVVACQAENNVPVVGRDEVRRHREMHWLRIDRYYAGSGDEVDTIHQPMMCQHCDSAPCENVCPVLATVHTSEGLNAQVYNRCVGTRYCANNCPYKVRRFNWFKYRHDDPVENLALNPDVTVRTRGVMEKCSFCVQRIQEAKIEAKRQGREPADGEVRPACQQSCPAGAIVFGDSNDPESRAAKLWNDPRRFVVLEELNLRPGVGYLTLVRNREETEEESHHG